MNGDNAIGDDARAGGESRAGIAAWPRWIAAALVAAAVPMSVLVTGPLSAAGLLWPMLGLLAVWGLVGALRTRGWRDPAYLLLLAFWVIFAAWVPYALRIAPNAVLGQREVTSMAMGGLVSLAVAGLARGATPRAAGRGVAALRLGWLAALVLTGGIAAWEITTHHHLWEAQRPWPFPKHTMVASTLYNPNNYGTALVAMIAATLAAALLARALWVRVGAVALAAAGVLLVVLTESRAALLAVLLLFALAVLAWVAGRPGGWRAATARAWRDHRALFVGGVAVVVLGAVALFTVPPLAAHNPIVKALNDSAGAETEKSDSMRIDLMRLALGYFARTNGLGTGASSFEELLKADPDPNLGVPRNLNLHNAFVEILTQYGVVVFVPLLALMLLVAAVTLSAALRRHSTRRRRVLGVEGAGYLLSYLFFGATASSALPFPTWWLALGAAVAVTGALLLPDAGLDPDAGPQPVGEDRRGAAPVVHVGDESRPG